MGKRKGINHAVRESTTPRSSSASTRTSSSTRRAARAGRALRADDIAAVGGRVHVSNPNENWLSRMQTIKYYFGQELPEEPRALDATR